MKVREVWEARSSLAKILTCPVLGIEVSWRLKTLGRRFSELEETFRILIQKYPTEQVNENMVMIKEESKQAYLTDIEKLLEEDFIIDHIPLLTLTEIKDASLTPMDLLALDWLISDQAP